MDTGWCTADLLQEVNGDADVRALVYASSLGGIVAILHGLDCARREWEAGLRSSAVLYLGEVMWMLGNAIWMLEDVLTGPGEPDWPPAYWTAVALFALASLSAAPLVFRRRRAPRTSKAEEAGGSSEEEEEEESWSDPG
mmetsp:Transcript_153302/g.471625  ORF Transcript_153302/g.471625 Transcript_153302/m.471625 type:complete len:139 (-) Transcript_153302:7-423(-)